ncbi:hypothetical protein M3Y94_00038300 [Aphelenchoides besseyi]|nr:hypothetical protein M3Y94_00038300 [Aphelenchoides besseyi]
MANEKEQIDVETADDNAIIDVGDYMEVRDRPLGVVENEVEVYSEARSVTEQSLPEMLSALFYGKLSLREHTFSTTVADAAINICLPNIADGYMFFDELHALAGPKLIRECQKYIGMQHGSCRVTRAYNATNFKCIIHTTLPADLSNQRLIDVELAQTAIRRCLNEAISRGAKNNSYFPAFSPIVSIEFVLKLISNWMFLTEQKGELSRLNDLQILCHSPSVYNIYRGMVRKLAIDFQETIVNSVQPSSGLFNVHAVVLRNMKKRRTRGTPYNPSSYEAYGGDQYGEMDFDGSARRRSRRGRGMDDFQQPTEPMQVHLELSAKLQPSVLVLDDKNGMKRQYRLTNKSKDGRKLYFRCSYCDTLIRKTNIQIRAKITLQDGVIVGDHFPEHHPDCKPKNSEELMVQQLDRKSRRDARRLAMEYHEEMTLASSRTKPKGEEVDDEVDVQMQNAEFEDENLEMEDAQEDIEQSMEAVRVSSRKRRRPSTYKPPNSLPNFPAWQQIRQQYFRMRKVGEAQKQKAQLQRAEIMRDATFVVPEEDEEEFVEVDGMMDQIDVMTVEPRKPRILQHPGTRTTVNSSANIDPVIKVNNES